MILRAIGAGLLALGLAACSSAPDDGSKASELAKVFRGTPKSAPAFELTPAFVAQTPYPLAEIATNTRRSPAVQVSVQSGIAAFNAQDSTTFAVRDGVLVAVRGLHSDVNSATGPSRAQIASATGSYARVYEILDGEGVLQKHRFTCNLAPAGQETVTVAGRSYASKQVVETCKNQSREFENRYWLDQSGKIRQSLQWIGSDVDFLRLSFA